MKLNDYLEITNEDNMELMKRFPDNYFNLAIVDPPYFDGPQKKGYYKGTKQITDVGDYKDLSGSWSIPDELYFNELFRVSKNQIVWGTNYFKFNNIGGRIVWIKGEQGSPFSMADVAYQSFYNRIDLYKYTWSGFWQEKGKERETRIHPTQKPVALYEWLFKNYANKCDKILDTHLGSGSIAIALHNMNERDGMDLTLTGCELDKDYYEASIKRIQQHIAQKTIFSQ